MKKTLLAAGVLATVLCASCSEKGKTDGAIIAKPQSDSATTAVCNFRYIKLQDVMENYTLAKELNVELQKETMSVENQARQKQNDLQQRGANVQSKYQSGGYLSQASFESDMQDLQKREAAANQWLSTHQNRLMTLGAEIQQRLNDSIQNFMNDYIRVYGYDAILIAEQAGFFNPALDITEDVIAGLNARYGAPAATDDKK